MKGRHAAATQVMQADGRTSFLQLRHADGSKQHQTADVSVGAVHSLRIGLIYALMVTSDILKASPPCDESRLCAGE